MICEKIFGHMVNVLRSFLKNGKAGCKMIWYALTGKKKRMC